MDAVVLAVETVRHGDSNDRLHQDYKFHQLGRTVDHVRDLDLNVGLGRGKDLELSLCSIVTGSCT